MRLTSIAPLLVFAIGCRMQPQTVTGSASSITGTNPPAAQSNNINNWNCTFNAFQGWTGGGSMSGYPTTQCHIVTHSQHSPGFDLGSPAVGAAGWSVDAVLRMNALVNAPGISQGLTINYIKTGIGDSVGEYIYHWNDGGAVAPADEGNSIISLEGGESNHAYAGTVTTGGSGATSVVTNCITDCGNEGDGRYLIDTHAAVATGTVSAYTNTSGSFTPGTLTISSTVAVSPFWGTLNANISTPLPSTLGTGTTSETFAVTKVGGSSAPSAGDLICFGGQFHEQAKIASVTGSGPYTITANLRHAHEASSWVMDGGACGTFVELTANNSSPLGQTLRYPFDVIGSTDAHTLVYRWFQCGSGSDSLHLGAFSTASGQNGFNLWAGAEVLDVNDGSGNVTGTFTLEPNTVAWNVNDTVEEPHHYASKNYLEFNNLTINNPAGSYAGGINNNFYGAGISGGGWWAWTQFAADQPVNGNAASLYVGHGGHLSAPNLKNVQGIWSSESHQYAPEGGPALYFGCPYAGCAGAWDFLAIGTTNNSYQALLGADPSGSGKLLLDVNPTFNDTSHSTNHVVCWKSSTQIGACSTQPDSTGACNCNLP